jgi:hypothetical protein
LFGAILAGIVLGGSVGYVLGVLSPELIHTFVRRETLADSAKTGLALGLLNGATYGFFGGAIIVVCAAILGRRRQAQDQ